jgi:LPXTG-motif cell wall-anchored protein
VQQQQKRCAPSNVTAEHFEKGVVMRLSIRHTSVIALGAVLSLGVASLGAVSAAPSPVGLGTAASYAVLAGTTVTNTGPSTVSGNLGVSPGTAVTGFPPGTVSNGTIHAADANALSAQAAVVTAYNTAAGLPTTGAISADLAGRTLTKGVYTGGGLALSGTLTLDAQGDPNAVFVFQAASTLVVNSSSTVLLVNGAGSCNVVWQVGSSATIGTGATFVGTVLALTSISAQTDASINGRLLARNGAVTLDSNTFISQTCSSPTTTTTTTATTTAATNGSTVSTGPATTAVGSGTTVPAVVVTTIPEIPGTGSNTDVTLLAGLLAVMLGGAAVIGTRRSPGRPTGE